MNLSILYRGPLSSCNYACGYCPFAKRTETPGELAHDRACLDRFVGWVGGERAFDLEVHVGGEGRVVLEHDALFDGVADVRGAQGQLRRLEAQGGGGCETWSVHLLQPTVVVARSRTRARRMTLGVARGRNVA